VVLKLIPHVPFPRGNSGEHIARIELGGTGCDRGEGTSHSKKKREQEKRSPKPKTRYDKERLQMGQLRRGTEALKERQRHQQTGAGGERDQKGLVVNSN